MYIFNLSPDWQLCGANRGIRVQGAIWSIGSTCGASKLKDGISTMEVNNLLERFVVEKSQQFRLVASPHLSLYF